MSERNYQFRERLEHVHKADRRDPTMQPGPNQLEIDQSWSIVVSKYASPLLLLAAQDLQHYLLISMNVSVRLLRVEQVSSLAEGREKVIVLATKAELPGLGMSLQVKRSYRCRVQRNSVVLCGHEDRGAAQGCYYLEDVMNLREAPVLDVADTDRAPHFSPRIVYSGWGENQYPDSYLNAIAHAGLDAIAITVVDVDRTKTGSQDLNDTIRRAARYGIDVYFYSWIVSIQHPDDPGAEKYYENTYGRLIRHYPGLKGLMLVRERVAFPEQGTVVYDPSGEMPAYRARDFYPQPVYDEAGTRRIPEREYDYAKWLAIIVKVTRAHNPELDIVFSTYNWGWWALEEDLRRLTLSLPKTVTLTPTIEMGNDYFEREGIRFRCDDFSITRIGPSDYFNNEAQLAKEHGYKLYSNCNTGGLTWDFGVIPYVPVPYQWIKRYEVLLAAKEQWGLQGLRESIHYGWWPSFVSDLAKWFYWSPSPMSTEELFAAVAKRDFSAEAVPNVLEAWRCWSEAIQHIVPSNSDQYGPFRIGPSFPLLFKERPVLPDNELASHGSRIVNIEYRQKNEYDKYRRVDVEIRSLQRMLELWQRGNLALADAIPLVPDRKRDEAQRMLNMNQFIVAITRTGIHMKQWWKLKDQLFKQQGAGEAEALLQQMEQLAELEIENAQAAIPLVEADSRLGWEPSMEYMTDPEHIEWKIAHMRQVLDREIPLYREQLAQTQK